MHQRQVPTGHLDNARSLALYTLQSHLTPFHQVVASRTLPPAMPKGLLHTLSDLWCENTTVRGCTAITLLTILQTENKPHKQIIFLYDSKRTIRPSRGGTMPNQCSTKVTCQSKFASEPENNPCVSSVYIGQVTSSVPSVILF